MDDRCRGSAVVSGVRTKGLGVPSDLIKEECKRGPRQKADRENPSLWGDIVPKWPVKVQKPVLILRKVNKCRREAAPPCRDSHSCQSHAVLEQQLKHECIKTETPRRDQRLTFWFYPCTFPSMWLWRREPNSFPSVRVHHHVSVFAPGLENCSSQVTSQGRIN